MHCVRAQVQALTLKCNDQKGKLYARLAMLESLSLAKMNSEQ